MFSKTVVTGAAANPLFRALTARAERPNGTSTSTLVDRRGHVVARFGSGTEPDSAELAQKLDAAL